MKQLALMAPLAALVFSTTAAAQSIPFFDLQFESTTIALSSDGLPGFDTRSGAVGTELITLSVDSVGPIDVATAGAVISGDLLTSSADVSASGLSNAVASTRFLGSFINGSAVNLSLDFSTLDIASGSGVASTSLYVSLVSDGVTLFSDYVQGAWSFAYTPLIGSTSVLDLTLSSEVSAAFPTPGAGDASAFGLVTIAGTVPEASTWLMFTLGLGAVGALRSRTRREAIAA